MTDTARSEWRTGKGALFACFLGMMLGPHVLPVYGQALFIQPLSQDLGWSRLQISFGTTILILTTAMAAPIAGYLADRVNIRYLVAASGIAEGAAFVLLSRATPNILSLYIPMALMALLGSACSSLSFSRVISAHFRRYRGTAFGMAMAGAGVSAIATPMLLAPYIVAYGWRAGYMLLALVMLAGSILMGIFIKMPAQSDGDAATPVAAQVHAGITLREASRLPHFWLLALLFSLIALSIGGLLTQLLPMLVDGGMTPAQAARQVSGIGVAIVVARLGTGILMDRFFAPRVASVLLVVASAGLLMVALGGARFGFLGALATGLAVGLEIDLIAYLIARYFGLRSYGRIYGVLYAILMIGTAISPLLYAWTHQHMGSYQPAVVGAAAVLGATALLFFVLPPYPRTLGAPERRDPAPAAVTPTGSLSPPR